MSDQKEDEMSDVGNTALQAIQEELELFRYMDSRLEQIELLLYRMDALAQQAAADITDKKRASLQSRLERLKEEIERIAAELSEYVPTTAESSEKVPATAEFVNYTGGGKYSN